MAATRNMISTFWKKEFRLELFGIEYSRPAEFVRCQWQKKSEVHIAYLIYRWAIAIYFFGSLINTITEPGRNPDESAQYQNKWPIYLTNWGYLMCALQAIVGVVIVSHKFYREQKQDYEFPKETKMPGLYQVYWILHSVSTVIAFGITAAYWVSIYNPALHDLNAINIMSHALNTVFMAIDLFIVCHPFRLMHFYWPFTFVTVYLLFSAIYYGFGGTDRRFKPHIYPILNWENGFKTVLACVLGLLFILFVHCWVWLLFLLRTWIYSRFLSEDKSQQGTNGIANSVTSDSPIHFDVV